MSKLSLLFLAPTLAAVLLGFASPPSNAARRVAGSPYDLECGDLHPTRGLRFRSRRRADRRWPRLFRGPKLPSEWRRRR